MAGAFAGACRSPTGPTASGSSSARAIPCRPESAGSRLPHPCAPEAHDPAHPAPFDRPSPYSSDPSSTKTASRPQGRRPRSHVPHSLDRHALDRAQFRLQSIPAQSVQALAQRLLEHPDVGVGQRLRSPAAAAPCPRRTRRPAGPRLAMSRQAASRSSTASVKAG